MPTSMPKVGTGNRFVEVKCSGKKFFIRSVERRVGAGGGRVGPAAQQRGCRGQLFCLQPPPGMLPVHAPHATGRRSGKHPPQQQQALPASTNHSGRGGLLRVCTSGGRTDWSPAYGTLAHPVATTAAADTCRLAPHPPRTTAHRRPPHCRISLSLNRCGGLWRRVCPVGLGAANCPSTTLQLLCRQRLAAPAGALCRQDTCFPPVAIFLAVDLLAAAARPPCPTPPRPLLRADQPPCS